MDPGHAALLSSRWPSPTCTNPPGDFERLARALRDQWGRGRRGATCASLRTLQPALRKGDWKVTVAAAQGDRDDGARSSTSGPASTRAASTASPSTSARPPSPAHLCDLATGEMLRLGRRDEPADPLRRGPDEPGQLRDDEPRRRRGDDRGGARRPSNALVAAIADRGRRSRRERSTRSVFVCNPVMHHLLLGIDPVELGQAPFALATAAALSLDARDLDLTHAPGRARLRPALHRRPCRGRCRGRGAVGGPEPVRGA